MRLDECQIAESLIEEAVRHRDAGKEFRSGLTPGYRHPAALLRTNHFSRTRSMSALAGYRQARLDKRPHAQWAEVLNPAVNEIVEFVHINPYVDVDRDGT